MDLILEIDKNEDAAGCGEEHIGRIAGIQTSRAELARNINADIHCRGCGDEIPQPRREAIPGCLYCIPCQKEMETGVRKAGAQMEYVFTPSDNDPEDEEIEEDDKDTKAPSLLRATGITGDAEFEELLAATVKDITE